MIPLLRPLVPDPARAVEKFRRSMASGQLTNFGPLTQELERTLDALMGGHVVLATTGTAALELALRTTTHKPIRRVLVPDFTHSGTLLAVKRAGLEPILTGVDEDTWAIRPETIEELARDGEIDAAIVVSPFGYEVDVAGFELASDRADVPLVYDFAGAFGYWITTAHPVCYSFHATKNLGACEGGAVRYGLTSEAAHGRRLSNFDTMPDRSIDTLDGGNLKLDEWRAALILAALELPTVSQRIENKSATLKFYLESFPELSAPDGDHFPSLCVVQGIKQPLDFQEKMRQADITVRPYYPLLSKMAACSELKYFGQSPDSMTTCVALPSDVTMSEAVRVADAIWEYLRKSNR